MQRNVGIYPGTFDPVHVGHVAFAREAARVCKLDEIMFLPETNPRGKQSVTHISHRIALLERALADERSMHVKKLTSPQFTVAQTLPEIRTLLPNTQVVFLMGSDIVKTFSYRWEGLDTLLREVQLAIGLRTPDDREDLVTILSTIETLYHMPVKHTFITTEKAEVSSSHIRKSSQYRNWLSPELVTYIQKHQLYPEH